MDIENLTPADVDFLESVEKSGIPREQLIERARAAVEAERAKGGGDKPPASDPRAVSELVKAETRRAVEEATWGQRVNDAMESVINADKAVAAVPGQAAVIRTKAADLARARIAGKQLSNEEFLTEVKTATAEALKAHKAEVRRIVGGGGAEDDDQDELDRLVAERADGVAGQASGGGGGPGTGDAEWKDEPLALGGLGGTYPNQIQIEQEHDERYRWAVKARRR